MNLETIKNIAKASGVTDGELVLIHFWGEDKDREIANNFSAAVAGLGASPFILQQSRSVNRDIFSALSGECYNEKYFDLFSRFDAVLDVFAYRPVVLGYDIEEKKLEFYHNYMAQLFKKLIKCKRFIQIRVPTETNALDTGLEPKDFINRMEMAYDVDYKDIYADCLKIKAQLQQADRIFIHSGENNLLNLAVRGREWHIDAGDGDFPCGEIYIAPLETETQGAVYFETIYVKETVYRDVTMYITDGRIQECSHQGLMDFLDEQPMENRIVCELGFGTNPNVTELCGYTVLDEKMSGTFHIAIGANHMFGGVNEASNHMDFVGHGKIRMEKEGTNGQPDIELPGCRIRI